MADAPERLRWEVFFLRVGMSHIVQTVVPSFTMGRVKQFLRLEKPRLASLCNLLAAVAAPGETRMAQFRSAALVVAAARVVRLRLTKLAQAQFRQMAPRQPAFWFNLLAAEVALGAMPKQQPQVRHWSLVALVEKAVMAVKLSFHMPEIY